MRRRIAIPLENGFLSGHFGHARQFAIIDSENGEIVEEKLLLPPPHEHGALPRWLAELDVTDLIAGGIGSHAVSRLSDFQINIFKGIPQKGPVELAKDLLMGELQSGAEKCSH